MTMKLFSIILTVFAGALFIPISSAMEMSLQVWDFPNCKKYPSAPCCKKPNIEDCRNIAILMEGEITAGDNVKLIEMLSKRKHTSAVLSRYISIRDTKEIWFSSPGGDIFEAMRIGRTIRNNMLSTKVPIDSYCNSACVLAFVGGVERIPVGPIGIHSFYSKDIAGTADYGQASKKYNAISLQVEKYFRDMRIPVALLDRMKIIPHYSKETLTFEELKMYGIFGWDPVYEQMISE